MLWKEKPGLPSQSSTLGSGASSNSQDSQVNISNNEFNYKNAYFNTTVKYEVFNKMLKETFVLYGLPSIKDYLYLAYSGNIKFNKTLQLCTDERCYTPSGTDDDFTTSGNIYFKDNLNKTIFYLNAPTIEDSNGSKTTGTYKVKGSNAQMNFELRINKTFLETAVYPIFIDPSISYNFSATYQEINSFASSCEKVANPPANNITPCKQAETDETGQLSLDTSNNNRLQTNLGDSIGNYQKFYYNITGIKMYRITSINLTWEGFGYNDATNVKSYVFNFSSNSWTLLETFPGTVTVDQNKSYYRTDVSNVINSSSNMTYFLFNYLYVSGTAHLNTDFVKLEVTYNDNIPPSVVNLSTNNSLFNSLTNNQLNYNVTDDDTSVINSTIYVWNSTNTLVWNRTTDYPTLGISNSFLVNVTRDDTYTYQINATDSDLVTNGTQILSFTINTVPPNLNILNPLNNSFKSSATQDINYSITNNNSAIVSCKWSKNNGVTNTTLGSCQNTSDTFAEGINTIYIWVLDSAGNEASNSSTFIIDTQNPILNLYHPFNGESYGFNTSISINYSVSDSNLQSCWYNLDNVINISLPNCLNSTFNSSVGNHKINIFANDSVNYITKVTNDYSISLTAPSISLIYPSPNSFINKFNITLNWTATDSDGISTCQIWNNFNGTFELNKTRTDIISGVQAFEYFNLTTEKSYNWSIFCNDTFNNGIFTLNSTFTIDATYPVINNFSVFTTIGSQTISFLNNITDLNLNTCKFSIYNSSGNIDGTNNNLSTNCQNDNYYATVSDYSTYYIIICGIDLAGNEICSTKNFETLESPITLTVVGGGGGSLGSSNSSAVALISLKDTNLTSLERAILYSRIKEYCLNKTNCILTSSQLGYLQDKLLSQNVALTTTQIEKWIDAYNNNLLEQVVLKLSDVINYALSRDILQIQTRKIVLSPATIDPFFALVLWSNEFHYEVTSNKVIRNISIYGDSEIYINKTSDTTFEVVLKVVNMDYSGKIFKASANVVDLDGNSVFLPVSIRSINLLNFNSIIITFLAFGGVIIGFIYRKDLNKVWKKK